MNHKDFIEALIAKGYTPYLADMFEKMFSDLEGRAKELSQLTSFVFQVNVFI